MQKKSASFVIAFVFRSQIKISIKSSQVMPKQKGGIQSKSWTFQYGISESVSEKK